MTGRAGRAFRPSLRLRTGASGRLAKPDEPRRARTLRSTIVDERVQLERTDEEKRPIVQRLARIEGQVHGVRQMIEDDRYCLDELQQIQAITAALREVALLIVGQHVREGIRAASREDADAAMADVTKVLRAAMRG